ncbi:CHAT domain-containing protein [Acidovorax sp. NCPPB 4044]|uniref:CHAT domain-containing protein n=1 Tax=Acidovorax sp. NCPPB 4044 TaxID=2940490 RepID=UPI002303AAB1|nr:CHAT domain-containing protein [Acidovorax sp. NCPPB 4044]MDA8523715.1 CHAT domain-containing protein [Acidovorax sp. NCPPB 4044]
MRLKVTDWVDATRWRWVLEEPDGRFIADHTVRLDLASRECQAFFDLARHLDYHAPVSTPQEQLRQLGDWVGKAVFGGLLPALRKSARPPAKAVQVIVPPQAQALLERPFEIACFADGKRFDAAGLRLVYQSGESPAAAKATGAALRMLAVFSLPVRAHPLNLRRERYQLQQLVRQLQQTHGLAVDLRVLQYGATRQTLSDALQEDDGWDVVHLSGHGQSGQLLLETEDGGEDPIDTQALGELLDPLHDRLQLLLLDACYSGAASHSAARVQVGLDATRDVGAEPEGVPAPEAAATPLPNLGHALAARLDCAVLAMRYAVDDSFATELMLALYEKLLGKRQPLPAALNLAVQAAVSKPMGLSPSALAGLTPMLLGARAGALQLTVPQHVAATALPTTGLDIGFPQQPARFVGRLHPMLRATQALAPHSPRRAVLFHGMPGAGKSACALELAYRHEQGRFSGYVWYQAPEAGSDIASSLYHLMHEIQRQLNAPGLGLTTTLDDPKHFAQYTLPRLRVLLQQKAVLLVVDNLETLLTDSDQWRMPLWGEVLETLLASQGLSRVVLTSRRVPVALVNDARVLAQPIHALSFAESVLLARELPKLGKLFENESDRELLRQTLRVVQGHPKLLELADGMAEDREALRQRVQAAEKQLADSGELLDAFFAKGGAHEGESQQQPEQFVNALQGWTCDVLSRLTPTAQRLFFFLCRLEPEDRIHWVVLGNWSDTLVRMDEADASARAEHGQGLLPALQELEEAGLIDSSLGSGARPASAYYRIHPGVAEAALELADVAFLDATDVELGRFFTTAFSQFQKNESDEWAVANAARRGTPYLMRTQQWGAAALLLGHLLTVDERPDTVAFALPVLKRCATATIRSADELAVAGTLAEALAKAGLNDEAEQGMRSVIDLARSSNQYRVASAVGADLTNLLRGTGRAKEALQVCEDAATDTRKAGLGPWTQIGDEGRRLQVMAALGHYAEVWRAVKRLRLLMANLPERSEANEAVDLWRVREIVLDTGHTAALYLEYYEEALELNDEIIEIMRNRGASALRLARTRFNDYGPLLALGRSQDARILLLECRRLFEAERYVQGLGKIFSALADVEGATGNFSDKPVKFECVALTYKYHVGDPDDCSISHHNLAKYLYLSGSHEEGLAHLLASATLSMQILAGHSESIAEVLANLELPMEPPPFDDVVKQVEKVPGVRFAELFKRLPRNFTDGDSLLAALWQLVRDKRHRWIHRAEAIPAVLAEMPLSVRAAFELEGDGFSSAIRSALESLPGDKSMQILQRLRETDLIRERVHSEPIGKTLKQFEPLLQKIAASIADEDQEHQVALEALLIDLHGRGFNLREPVHRMCSGERNAPALVAGLDATDTRLIERLLELVSQPTGDG